MLKPGEIIPLTDDDMFTEVFNNEENICILEEFISTYFNYPLDIIRGNLKIMPRKIGKARAKEKSKEVDLLLKYNNKNYNIEMSTGWNQSIIDRNVLYLSSIHGRQLEKGDNYYKIDESIQLNLCAFKNGNKKREKYYITSEEGEILTTKFRLDVVYIENLKNMCYTESEEINTLITWSKIFQCKTKKELENAIEKILSNKSKEQLISDISRLSGDEVMVKKYEGKTKWESERDCIMHGFEIERKNLDAEKKNLNMEKKNLENERKKVIVGLLDLNIPAKDIASRLNVSIDYVNEIKSDL